ncbi:MAG: LamG-like jellyroll fold domain-containing protein [Bacteroidota bacterium]
MKNQHLSLLREFVENKLLKFCEAIFPLVKAKNTGIARLRRGFSTQNKGKRVSTMGRLYFTNFLIIIFAIYSSPIIAIDWLGGEGNWETPSRWSCNCIPSMSDAVYIPENSYVIINGSAQASSIRIQETSRLLNNSGVVTRYIANYGKVTNASGGIITIDDHSGNGILNWVDAEFYNLGTLNISRVSEYGIRSLGYFENDFTGTINISNLYWGDAFYNDGGILVNQYVIDVSNIPDNGMINHRDGSITNNGNISISNIQKVGLSAGTFSNSGTLRIEDVSKDGATRLASHISISGSTKKLTNTGVIEIPPPIASGLTGNINTIGCNQGGILDNIGTISAVGNIYYCGGTVGGNLTVGNTNTIKTLSLEPSKTINGELNIEIAGNGNAGATNGYDRLNIRGTGNISGALNLSLLNNFELEFGDKFQVVTCNNGCNGSFNTFVPPTANNGGEWNIIYNTNNIEVVYNAPLNNALYFDGVNDYIIGNGDPTLELSKGTIELWITPQSKPTKQTFLAYRNETGSKTRYLWNFLENLSGIGFWNGSEYTTLNYNFNAGQTYHLAFVENDNFLNTYIDGNFYIGYQRQFGSATGDDMRLILGVDYPLSEYFNGQIDEVRIWNRALTDAEVQSHMNCRYAVPENCLVAYYTFNQGTAGGNNVSETILVDATENDLDLTLMNFALTGTSSNWIASNAPLSNICPANNYECSPSFSNCQNDFYVQPFYLITSDYNYVQAEYDTIVSAMEEIQAWYQVATGGKTFRLGNQGDPIVVNLPNTSVYYEEDYWTRILDDLTTLGYTNFQSGVINLHWIKGGGGVALGAQACGSNCGTGMVGMDLFPTFNTQQFFSCPNASGGVAAYPCTPLGAAAHELGHCFGLPHPIDRIETSAVANHSVMQTHWNYPYNYAPAGESPWGFLSLERQTLLRNPFFCDNVDVKIEYDEKPIVNLPNLGSFPFADFTFTMLGGNVIFENISLDSEIDYWTFGDETGSNLTNPIHTFGSATTYEVRLRVSNSEAMMDMYYMPIQIDSICKHTLNVNDLSLPSATYQATNYLYSNSSIANEETVNFTAGEQILLSPNFHAELGSSFSARIATCNAEQQQRILAKNKQRNSPLHDDFRHIRKKDEKPISPMYANCTKQATDLFEERTHRMKSIHHLEIIPNPASTFFTIKADYNYDELTLYNSFGEVVRKLHDVGTTTNMDVSNLHDGIYFLSAKSSQKIATRKIIIE